jgi:uncharacterized protein (DUF305 family)
MRAYSKVLLLLIGSIPVACERSERQTADQDSLTVTASADSIGRSRIVDTATGTIDSVAAPAKSTTDPDVKGVEHWRDLDPKRPPARDNDHQFLRTMADHNEGMVEMVAFAKDRAAAATTKEDMGRIRDGRARLRTEVIDMIRNKYQETFVPVASPLHNDRLDSLDLTKQADFDRAFYQRALEHHRQWIRSIDTFSARLTDASVKAFATRLKSELQSETDAFARRLTGAGG